MNDTKDNKPIRGYHRLSKTWYAKQTEQTESPEIMVGMYYPRGGCAGEMSVTWERLDNRLVPQLKAFDSGWKLLVDFKDLVDEMAKWDGKNITEEEFAKLLDKVGFTDLTRYEQNVKPRYQPKKSQSDSNKKFRR